MNSLIAGVLIVLVAIVGMLIIKGVKSIQKEIGNKR
jgi:hypothetical protein